MSTKDMDSRLEKASRLGDLDMLNALMAEDPLILEKAAFGSLKETPLHIASLAGKTEFVKKINELMPGFAYDRNQDGLTPLHIASALGYEDMVSLLLKRKPNDLCLIRDSRGRTPLHHAAINGHISVIEMLLSKCSKALVVETLGGDTALHLALRNEKPDAFEALAKPIQDYAAFKNKHGRVIRQVAVETNQSQVLSSFPEEKPENTFSKRPRQSCRPSFDPKIKQVVASLVATVTFQAAANPPPSIWRQGMKLQYGRCYSEWNEGLTETCSGFAYLLFMSSNTVGFVFSLLVLVTFNKGPFSDKSLRISLTSFPITYTTLLLTMSPDMTSVVISVSCLWILIWVALVVHAKTHGRIKPTRRRPESWI